MSTRSTLLWCLVVATAGGVPRSAAAQAAAVQVGAVVSPERGQVGDAMRLDITVATAGAAPDAIDVPTLPAGLRLTGSSDFTRYEFRLPGGRRRTTRRELTIRAVAPGHYVIPPIAVHVAGEVYRTRPVRLDVTGGGPAGASPAGGITAAGSDQDVLLQSWATPDTVFVGQQITMRADALFSLDVRSQLAGVPQYQAPSAPGFWVYDLPDANITRLRPVRGRIYEVQTFRRAFFPLMPGRLFVPGADLSYSLRRGFLSGPESHELRSDSFPVVVRPLPSNGRPPDFSGAVGQYSASARIEPGQLSAGEAATLTLAVTGTGNIKALAPPQLPTIPDVDVFSPSEDIEMRPDAEDVGGTKRFSWVLVPRKPGPLVIPALELPYFDPGPGRYERVETAPMHLQVVAAPATAVARAPASLELRPLRDRDSGAGVAPWLHSGAFLALETLPLLAFLGLVLERRRRVRRPVVRPNAGPALRERLRAELAAFRSRIDAASGGEAGAADAALPGELLTFLRAWLAERLGVPELTGVPVAGLDAALRGSGVRATVAVSLQALATRLAQARYRPEPPSREESIAWLDDAERLLVEVDGRRRGRREARGPAGPVVALALGGALAGLVAAPGPASAWTTAASGPVPPAAAPAPLAAAAIDSAFAHGVAAYRTGNFVRAATLFEGYAAAHPEHAAAWYDLGNPAYRSGQRGRAVWAWLRALELLPRDSDVRQNLALAGADPALVDGATPPVAASVDELLLLAGLLWLLGGAALAWQAASGSRLAARVGWVAVLLAALGAGLALAGRPRAGEAVSFDAGPLLGAPVVHADSVGAVGAGAAVRVLERQAGWSRVRLQDGSGSEGWLPQSRLGRL